ncbi:MAG TPA: ribonuclease H-like domain-containing protein [Clostridiales bacterium]|nr:ribonuclease H-like domain-containing protein [Clostridiales bacterium]
MIKKHFRISSPIQYHFKYELGDILFFDIETTGFSPKTNYIYLIGCCYYKDSTFHIKQWFSDDLSDEVEIIDAFFKFIKNFKAIIHYNGASFDMPFLQKKSDFYKLNHNFNNLDSIDIYREILQVKNLLNLPNYKLKTIESFLNIKRKDEYSGGELIEVYQSYLGLKKIDDLKKITNEETKQILYKLLLHNEDDLRGLLDILPILNYSKLFEESFSILKTEFINKQLHIAFDYNTSIPKPIKYKNDLISFEASRSYGLIIVSSIIDTLKYFYKDYKNYYYLTKEDVAIHKSLAAFVDNDYKEKAKVSNCYSKKYGEYIPQFKPVLSPYFQYQHNDKITYLEYTDELITDPKFLDIYVKHILRYIKKDSSK